MFGFHSVAAIGALLGCAALAHAKQDTRPGLGLWFEPLSVSNIRTDAASKQNNPFDLPPNFSQTKVVDWVELNATFAAESITYPTTFRSWDMLDVTSARSDLIFIPHETSNGAGLTRVQRDEDDNIIDANILLKGVAGGSFDTNPLDGWNPLTDNYGTFDPVRVTPSGTVVIAEEGGGAGRIFELLNPYTATSQFDAQWRWLSNIPSVSHEGIMWDKAGNMYFIDEFSSGSIYKFVPSTWGDFSHGQVFVLKITGSSADGAVGAGYWYPITDTNNVKTTTANPFAFSTSGRGGRTVADEVGAPGYCRPEDMTIKTLLNGNQALYFPATCVAKVYSVELLPDGTNLIVREFVSQATPDTIGHSAVGGNNTYTVRSYGFITPDNVEVDKAGNVLIIEDNEVSDIWLGVDTNNDGVAEYMGLMFSLGNYGCEATGIRQDPRDPFTFLVNVQHPSDANDAMWKLTHDITEYCDCSASQSVGSYVSCVTQATGTMGITGDIKKSLVQIAQLSGCGSS